MREKVVVLKLKICVCVEVLNAKASIVFLRALQCIVVWHSNAVSYIECLNSKQNNEKLKRITLAAIIQWRQELDEDTTTNNNELATKQMRFEYVCVNIKTHENKQNSQNHTQKKVSEMKVSRSLRIILMSCLKESVVIWPAVFSESWTWKWEWEWDTEMMGYWRSHACLICILIWNFPSIYAIMKKKEYNMMCVPFRWIQVTSATIGLMKNVAQFD